MAQLLRVSQSNRLDDPDDQLSASEIALADSTAENLEELVRAFLSQLKRFLHGDIDGNWHDDPVAVYGLDASLLSMLFVGPSVTGQIDGGSPPSAGTAGRVFIVTTAGGAYRLHELWRDTGVSWTQIPAHDGMRITVTDGLSGGTAEYLGDHVYIWDADGSQWVNIGPDPFLTKVVRDQRNAYTYVDTGDSDFGDPIPAQSVVTSSKVNVIESFNGVNPTLIVGDAVDPDGLVDSGDVNLRKIGIYIVDGLYLYTAETQVIVNLSIAGTPTKGQCFVYMEYGVE